MHNSRDSFGPPSNVQLSKWIQQLALPVSEQPLEATTLYKKMPTPTINVQSHIQRPSGVQIPLQIFLELSEIFQAAASFAIIRIFELQCNMRLRNECQRVTLQNKRAIPCRELNEDNTRIALDNVPLAKRLRVRGHEPLVKSAVS